MTNPESLTSMALQLAAYEYNEQADPTEPLNIPDDIIEGAVDRVAPLLGSTEEEKLWAIGEIKRPE
jgi:hypothetical protein